MKFILVLRDPVERAISDYTQSLSKKQKSGSFETKAFSDNGEINLSFEPIRLSVYVNFFTNWLKYFNTSEIKIVDSAELISRPWNVMHGLESFLNIPHHLNETAFFFNKTKGFYCLHNMLCLDETKGRKHFKISAKARKKLLRYYEQYNQMLHKISGYSFNCSFCGN